MATRAAEQLLISSILRNGDLRDALAIGLDRKMFFKYPEEYGWIEDFYLKRSRTPTKAAFTSRFTNFTIKAVDDTEYFTEEVREEYKRRSGALAVNDVMNLFDAGKIDDALNLMYTSAMKINSDMGLINDGDIFREHDDILKEFMMRKERFEAMGTSGIPTGFPTFDENTGGYAPGEFWVWAARPGSSKSFTLQKQAAFAALAGYTVQFNALEQPRSNVMARIISLISKEIGGQLYSSRNLIQGKDYDHIEFLKFMKDLKERIKGRLHVVDGTRGRVTTSMVASQIERNKPDIVFVDHITLMGKRTNDWQGVGEVSTELTQIANQYQIPIVAASQQNRSGSQKGTGVETIAESDKIGQDAAGVVFINQMSRSVIHYENVKYRNGTGNFEWYAKFQPDKGIFKEVPKDAIEELMMEDAEEKEQGR